MEVEEIQEVQEIEKGKVKRMKRLEFMTGLVIVPVLAMAVFYPGVGQAKSQVVNLLQSQVVNTRLNTLQNGVYGSRNSPKVGIN